ncbi:hypothetical protein JTB14_017534 [Gonioctena quinquepunctata]|nr:hypothetical protein JTB14_017534 [Gonioctena quinquepunctata]
MKASKALSEPIHDIASTTMRNLIFPAFREGPVKETIRFDRMIILYGNEMCLKYRAQHNYAMIRNRMIRLAKMLLQIKSSTNDVEDFKDVLKPKHFDDIMKVVNYIGNYNSTTGNYEKPTLPTEIGAFLKYVIKLFISECIKESNMELKKESKHLLHLLQTALPAHINKTAAESLLQQKRHKTPLLPSMDDIQTLNLFLLRERVKHHEELEKKFSLYHWIQLGRFTLVTVLLFNRRRPGEMERALVSDLKIIQMIDKDAEIYGKLSDEERLYVNSYLRFVIRGKLARGVPVLLHMEVYESIKLLLKYRQQAGVLQENPFIFAMPQKRPTDDETIIYRHHIATNLIRKFSEECGAKNPSTLRATILRKHVATLTTSMNLDTDDLHNFQNYMGHADKIHREFYRQPIIEKDILKVSKVLLMAQGRCSAGVSVTQKSSSISTPAATTLSLKAHSSNSIATNFCVNDDVTSRTSVGENSTIYTDCRIVIAMEDDDYIPQESDCDDDSNDDEDGGKPCRKRRRLFDMDGGVANIKRRWSTSEKDAVRKIFASEFESGKIPTLTQINKATVNCIELKKRTLPQIRLWIMNNMNKKPTARRSWDSPAKKTIIEKFDRYITGPLQRYPSTSTILKTISTNASLMDKTPRRIRSQIQNQKRLFQKSSSLQQQKFNNTF